MPEEQQPKPAPGEPPRAPGRSRHRGRRGGRGRRLGPRLPPKNTLPEKFPPEQPPVTPVAPAEEFSAATATDPETPSQIIQTAETSPAVLPPPQKIRPAAPAQLPPQRFRSPPPFSAAAASALGQAVDEVHAIVESLEHALEQMEEVMRLVETAERQKIGDEHEIESLRRALRQLQSRGGRPERFERPDRPERPEPQEGD
jgi:hypothetical protein